MASSEDDHPLYIRNSKQHALLCGCTDDLHVVRHTLARGLQLKSNPSCESESSARVCHLT